MRLEGNVTVRKDKKNYKPQQTEREGRGGTKKQKGRSVRLMCGWKRRGETEPVSGWLLLGCRWLGRERKSESMGY